MLSGLGGEKAGEKRQEPCCGGLSWQGVPSRPLLMGQAPSLLLPSQGDWAGTADPGDLLLLAAGVEGKTWDTTFLAGHSGDISTDEFKASWTL